MLSDLFSVHALVLLERGLDEGRKQRMAVTRRRSEFGVELAAVEPRVGMFRRIEFRHFRQGFRIHFDAA